MREKKIFNRNGYVLAKNFISIDLANCANTYALNDERDNYSVHPDQMIKSHGRHADRFFDAMLVHCLDRMEEATSLKLNPAYSYFRVYRPGNSLVPHKDQDKCQVLASVLLGRNYMGKSWPLFIEDNPIYMNVGDAAILRGTELTHHRNEFVAEDGAYHTCVFLGYTTSGPL